jgi:Flp pilus assembly protein TadG
VTENKRQVSSVRSRKHREDGAALVEFAVLAPLLILLLFGIIEFGYLFAQYNEIRHAAREGARYASVSNPDPSGGGVDAADVIDVVCGALNLPGGSTFDLSVTVTDPAGITLTGSGVGAGNTGSLTLAATIPSLTSFPIITSILPDELSNTAVFRVERQTEWSAPISGTGLTC